MTSEFELLLRLYACAASGEVYPGQVSQSQRAKVITLAAASGCSSMIMLALSEHGAQNGEKNEAAEGYIKRVLFDSCAKNAEISRLLEKLNAEGVETLLLKGQAVASLYRVPECRISSDTDLLIDEKDEKKAYRIMKQLGYSVIPRTSYSHHATAYSEASGTVELHTSLFFGMLTDVLFDGNDITELLCEEHVRADDPGMTYTTLGYTDHLIFLTFHMIQHFIRSGTSVRQLYDILIYTKSHRDKIDIDRYISLTEQFGYRQLLDTVYSFGVKYFSFSPDSFPEYTPADDSVLEAFASDLENGGWIGKGRYDGEELFRHYGSTRAKNKEKYKKYIKSQQRQKILSSIFPSRERIEAQFGFAKYTLLLPVGWICWLFYGLGLYFKGDLRSDVDDRGLDEVQRKRLQLFSDLGL